MMKKASPSFYEKISHTFCCIRNDDDVLSLVCVSLDALSLWTFCSFSAKKDDWRA